MTTPYLDLLPMRRVNGNVTLPGSKSITIRALLLAALAEGNTRLSNVLDSDDARVMLDALRALGVGLEELDSGLQELNIEDNGYWLVRGAREFPSRKADIFVGNSGLSIRTLAAALAFSNGHYRLHGVPRMHERPIADLVDALTALGANIRYEQNAGYPPLIIEPAKTTARSCKVKGDVSSQFLTGLLLAAPLAAQDGDVTIEVEGELISKPYIEITLSLMEYFDVVVRRDGFQKFIIPKSSRYRSPGSFLIENDASSASYFLAAGVIAGNMTVTGIGKLSIQGDAKFAEEVLDKIGGRIEFGNLYIIARAPKDGNRLRGIDFDANAIPDAAMTLAVVALFCEGATTIRNIGSWRVKETDRIAAMATELRKVGATVEEGADWIKITPPEKLTPNAVIDTYDDHRMAMCFSLVALGDKGVPVRINHPECVAKTFPNYFDELASISAR